jgi:hypothetical protein
MRHRMKVALGVAAVAATLLPNTPAATAATFSTPVVVSGNDVTEPGVEVAPDGTIYVHAPAGLPLWSWLWRSTNGGSSWVLPLPVTRAGLGGGDIDITIQPNGKLAFTDLWLGSSSVGMSSDRANTWVTSQFQGTAVQDRQWVANTGRDIVYHVTHQIPAGHVVSKSVDGGVTYPVQSLAASVLDQTGCICPPGYLIARPGVALAGGTDDRVGVSYYTSLNGVKFARSINGGLTWSQANIDPAEGNATGDGFPIVADDGNGKIHAVWLETSNSMSRVMYSFSSYTTPQTWGVTWSTPTPIVSTGASVFPWIDAKGDKVSVALYHSTTSGNPNNVSNSAQWNVKYLESTTDGASWGPLTTADSTVVKTGPICTDGLNCGGDRELGDFLMVALDNASMANISYIRSIDGEFDTEVRFVKQTS